MLLKPMLIIVLLFVFLCLEIYFVNKNIHTEIGDHVKFLNGNTGYHSYYGGEK